MSVKNNETINEKMIRLREITGWFSSDEFTIEDATERFAEAEKLAHEIEHDLESAKNEITVLKQKFDHTS